MYERTVNSRTAFQGRLLRIDVHEVELADGRRSAREIVCHPGAAVILAERDDGRFVLVRQYRKAIERVLLEVVAGTLDPPESPAACADRELREETGYTARRLTFLGRVVPVPGYSQEILHVFHAWVDGVAAAPTPDADEQVESVLLAPDELERMITAGEIEDGKTLAAWMLYRQRRHLIERGETP